MTLGTIRIPADIYRYYTYLGLRQPLLLQCGTGVSQCTSETLTGMVIKAAAVTRVIGLLTALAGTAQNGLSTPPASGHCRLPLSPLHCRSCCSCCREWLQIVNHGISSLTTVTGAFRIIVIYHYHRSTSYIRQRKNSDKPMYACR